MSSWEFQHMGFVVQDLERAVEHYRLMGFNPTSRPEFVAGSNTYKNFKLYGKTPDSVIETRIRFIDNGSVYLELLQPLKGYSLHNEFLDAKGEGISHICYVVDDLDKETEELTGKGFPVILSGEVPNGPRLAYFDTREVGGLILELIGRVQRRE